MSANDINIFNESLNVLKERVSGFERLEERDINHLQSEIDKINNDLAALNSGLKHVVNNNSENIKMLESELKNLTEKYQEQKGEINQIQLKFDHFQTELSNKDAKKTNIMTNLVFPIIASIVVTGIIYFASTFFIFSKLVDSSAIPKIEHVEK